MSNANDKWLILDRDGVINADSDQFIKSPDEWIPLPGSLEAMAQLHQASYKLVVISNQSGLARGLFTQENLHNIHQKFIRLLAKAGGKIEKIYFCPHGPDDACTCRKPLPGMLKTFAADFNVQLESVWAVGDSVRDLVAAYESGAKFALVRTGKGLLSEKTLHNMPGNEPISQAPIYDDLAAFSAQLLKGALK